MENTPQQQQTNRDGFLIGASRTIKGVGSLSKDVTSGGDPSEQVPLSETLLAGRSKAEAGMAGKQRVYGCA